MPKRVYLPCPICGNNKNSIVFSPRVEIDDPERLYGADQGLSGTQTIVRCASCQMLYENPRYEDSVILEAYSKNKGAGHDSQYFHRVQSFLAALRKLKRHLPDAGAKVLDVGCAGGAFLQAASKSGYVVTGLEPSAALVRQGRARGFHILEGTLFDHEFSERSFDLVTLWDVLEHVTEPKSTLLQIRKIIKPEGILLINYPDIGTWQAKCSGKRFWWLVSVHLHYFTAQTLSLLCELAKFKIFYRGRYWQRLELGYLQDVAIHYGFPMIKMFREFTPNSLRSLQIPYYASQTTVLCRCLK